MFLLSLGNFFVRHKRINNYSASKGGQGKQSHLSLKDHLLKNTDNEKIEVLVKEGLASLDDKAAIDELSKILKTEAKKELASIIISPPVGMRLTKENIEKMISLTLRNLGYQNCPHMVIQHWKNRDVNYLDPKEGLDSHFHILVAPWDWKKGQEIKDKGMLGRCKNIRNRLGREFQNVPRAKYLKNNPTKGRYRKREKEAAFRAGWKLEDFRKTVIDDARRSKDQAEFLERLKAKDILLCRSEKNKQGSVLAAKGKNGKFYSMGSFSSCMSGLEKSESFSLRSKVSKGNVRLPSISEANKGTGYSMKAPTPAKPSVGGAGGVVGTVIKAVQQAASKMAAPQASNIKAPKQPEPQKQQKQKPEKKSCPSVVPNHMRSFMASSQPKALKPSLSSPQFNGATSSKAPSFRDQRNRLEASLQEKMDRYVFEPTNTTLLNEIQAVKAQIKEVNDASMKAIQNKKDEMAIIKRNQKQVSPAPRPRTPRPTLAPKPPGF